MEVSALLSALAHHQTSIHTCLNQSLSTKNRVHLKCSNLYSTTEINFLINLTFSVTVHKAQGLNVNTAIADAGPASFGCGMIYTCGTV